MMFARWRRRGRSIPPRSLRFYTLDAINDEHGVRQVLDPPMLAVAVNGPDGIVRNLRRVGRELDEPTALTTADVLELVADGISEAGKQAVRMMP